MHAVTLTDDEVVAAAMGFGVAWRSPLPTVDSSSTVDLAAAARRGWRSLTARELLGQRRASARGLATPLSELLAPAFSPATPTVMFVADDVNAWHLNEPTIVGYEPAPGTGEWLVEAVDATGLHFFERGLRADTLQLFRATADAAYERGVSTIEDGAEISDRLWLCFGGLAPDGETLRIAKGRSEWISVTAGADSPRYVRCRVCPRRLTRPSRRIR